MAVKRNASKRTIPSAFSWIPGLLKWMVAASLLGLLAIGTIFGVAWMYYSRDADDFLKLFAVRETKTISKVLDRNGEIIGIFSRENRVVIPYEDIPPSFVKGLIATEDAEFWSHRGISFRGMARAGFRMIVSFGRRREGASTLTMQLVRNVTARRQKRLERKLQEMILAIKLERAYSKKQILEQYVNEVYFGYGRYGLESAAQHYFGKSALQLYPEESSLLVGMVQAPGYYDPFSLDPAMLKKVKSRRDTVLGRMQAAGYLKAHEAKSLMEKPLRLARERSQEEALAPYAVEEIRKYLFKTYGEDTVLNGGFEVYTTLDSAWQDAANEAVRKGVRAVDRRRGFRKESLEYVDDPEHCHFQTWKRAIVEGDEVRGVIIGWSGDTAEIRFGMTRLFSDAKTFAWAGPKIKELLPRGAAPLFRIVEAQIGRPFKVELSQEPQIQGALLAIDPITGAIRAMVGGYDFNKSKFNRTVQAERQVGSTMKAFVYGAAFEQGLHPASLVKDIPTRWQADPKPYEPQNYERDFWGPIIAWEALRDSRNLPAVRTLDAVGPEAVIDYARRCGISGRIPAVPSMALGTPDLTLKEMVRAYGTLARMGVQTPTPFLILKVVDRQGQILEQNKQAEGQQVLEAQSAFQLIQCLQGVAQQGTGARSNELGWPVAGKTGTTDDYTDAWFLGFSTRLACGVWVGLDEKKTIFRGADGAKCALPIWVDFMKSALPSTQREEFQAPEEMEWAEIDRYTGLRATQATWDKVIKLAFKPGQVPKSGSDAEAIQKIKEARDRARGNPVEARIWGKASLELDAEHEWRNTKDPNEE